MNRHIRSDMPGQFQIVWQASAVRRWSVPSSTYTRLWSVPADKNPERRDHALGLPLTIQRAWLCYWEPPAQYCWNVLEQDHAYCRLWLSKVHVSGHIWYPSNIPAIATENFLVLLLFSLFTTCFGPTGHPQVKYNYITYIFWKKPSILQRIRCFTIAVLQLLTHMV
jgi:hypothetical protein